MRFLRVLPSRSLATAAILIAAVVVLGAIAPRRSEADPSGGYLDFTGPGVGFMEVASDADLQPTEEVTVEAWVYLRTYGGFGDDGGLNCPMLVSKNFAQAYSLALACGADVGDAFINSVEAPGNLHVPLNTWTHVAMTYDGITLRLYLNGQLDVEQVIHQNIGVTADPLEIGHDVQWDRTPDGSIDDVRVWRVARTQQQIAAGMNGVSSNAVGLAARWTFDGGSLGDLVSGRTGNLIGDVHVVIPTPTPSPSPSPTPSGGTSTPTPSPLPTGSPVQGNAKGDVDCDQHLGLPDVLLFLIALADFTEIDASCGPQAAAALPSRLDIDCSGAADDVDVLALLKYIGEIDPGLPVDCALIGATPAPGPTGSAGPSVTATESPTPTATQTPVAN